MRSLSELLEKNQVMRTRREASLAEADRNLRLKPVPEYLFGIRDGQVVAFKVIKRTPKFIIRFANGNPNPHPSTARSRSHPVLAMRPASSWKETAA